MLRRKTFYIWLIILIPLLFIPDVHQLMPASAHPSSSSSSTSSMTTSDSSAGLNWADTYDDFRVNTSAPTLKRWNLTTDGTASLAYQQGARIFSSNYTKRYYGYNVPDPVVDYMTSVDTDLWDDAADPYDRDDWEATSYGLTSKYAGGTYYLRSSHYYDYSDARFNLSVKMQAKGMYYGRIWIGDDTHSIEMWYDIIYVGDGAYALEVWKMVDGAQTRLKNIPVAHNSVFLYFFVSYLRISDTELRVYYCVGDNVSFSELHNHPEYIVSWRYFTVSINPGDYNNFRFRLGVRDYADNDICYHRYLSLTEYHPPLLAERGVTFSRRVVPRGQYLATLEFNKWTAVNTSSYFYFMKGTSGFILENMTLYAINNDIKLAIVNITTKIKYSLSFAVAGEGVTYVVKNDTAEYHDTITADSDITDTLLYFELYQNNSYDQLEVILDYVEAPFLANAPNIDYSAKWSSIYGETLDTSFITTATPQGIEFDGDQPNTSVYVTFTYYVQDFRSISGLIKTAGATTYSSASLEITICPINTSGYIDYSDTGTSISPDPELLMSIKAAHAWGASAGFSYVMIRRITDYSNYLEYDVARGYNVETGFYYWYKNRTDVQAAIRFQNLTADDTFEDDSTKMKEQSPTIAAQTNWFSIRFTYQYYTYGETGKGSHAKVMINSLAVEKGKEFTPEPVMMSPAPPSISSPPTGFFGSLIAGLLAPFFWLGGVFASIGGAFVDGLMKLLNALISFLAPLITGLIELLWTTIGQWLGTGFDLVVNWIIDFLRNMGLGDIMDTLFTTFDIISQTIGKGAELFVLFTRSDIINITMVMIFAVIVLVPAFNHREDPAGWISEVIYYATRNALPISFMGINIYIPLGLIPFFFVFVTILGVI